MPARMPPRFLTLPLTSTLLLLALAGFVWGPLLPRIERARDSVRARENDAARETPARSDSETQAAQLGDAYGRLPLGFEANEGQTDRRVNFVSRGSGYTLFLTPTEAVLRLRIADCGLRNGQFALPRTHPERGQADDEPCGDTPSSNSDKQKSATRNPQPAIIRMSLVGANSRAAVAGLDELQGKSNYLIGRDPSKWRTNVANYSRVRYTGIYPGVDLEYYGNQRQLEYDFRVAPGTSPDSIRLGFKGANRLRVDEESGDLLIATAGGELRQHKPVVYQEVGGQRREVEGRYALKGKGTVGFAVADYDRTQPLVIDPVLSYSTLIGTGQSLSVAVDSFGDAYVTGSTTDSTFPTTAGVLQTTRGASSDAFVTKMNATGAALIYSTFLGGDSDEQGSGVAVDSNGDAYVALQTDSDDLAVVGGFKNDQPGSDGYLAKLDPKGASLLYSTYVGGGGSDSAEAVAVDSAGNAYVAGFTKSSDFLTLPAPASTFRNSLSGTQDGFLVKVNTRATGNASFVYGTFLGGAGSDDARSVAVDFAGQAVACGVTNSADFPLQSASQNSLKGSSDGFVTKMNAAGTAPVFSTYLGGGGADRADGVAADAAGNIYVASDTSSTDFPVAGTPAQAAYGGGPSDAAVTKFTPAGAISYSTFVGGSGNDFTPNGGSSCIAVDSHGDAVVTGDTASSDFPTVNASQPALAGGQDMFVTKLNPSGSQFVYSTYLGGSGADNAAAVALDTFGNAYVVGDTFSNNFPRTSGAFDTTFTGFDATVTGLSQLGSCGTTSYSNSAGSPFSVGSQPFSAAVGDFNGDGKLDLAVANSGANTVSVLPGDGTGSFGAATNFNVGSSPASVAVSDFNGDGKQDIATADLGANTVSVLLGDGAGGFAAATNFNVGSGPQSLSVGDFNGDGKPDIATANFNANTASILLGNGAGSFDAATNFNAGNRPDFIAVGDFNLDGKLDLAITNQNSNDVSILLGNGAGSFGAATNFATNSGPQSVAVGDFNLDGKLDLAVGKAGQVSVLLGDGAGNFGAESNFATGGGTGGGGASVAVGDFNGDGKPDIATGNFSAANVSILLGDGTGSFGTASNFNAGTNPQSVAVGDFNGDGKPDLAVANFVSNNVSVLLDSCGLPTGNTVVVTNTNDSGAGSLRQAILDSNATAGTKETITFNIAGAGVHTIQPTSALPTITDPVIIDGYTQPGASKNTLATGTNAVIEIELDGTNAGATASGLAFTGGGSTARGLVINRFGSGAGPGGTGIELNSDGNTVEGCFIGTNAAGTSALANNFDAVSVGGKNNLVGGSATGARNLLSGNGRSGVLDNGGGAGSNNKIQNNLIGTNAAGAAAIANGQGVIIFGTSGDTVGGTTAGLGNVISGNGLDGVSIDKAINPADNNSVVGNLIGTKADGTGALGNARHGVFLADALNNAVGGAGAGAANTIAFNGVNGVAVTGASTGDSILTNSIHDNTSLGIDLNADGVTTNDAGDADTGANNLQNFPVLTSATSGGGNTTIQGTLNSTASTTFRVEFFSNATCDPSGNGEGRTFLGFAAVNTDASGNATINATLGATTVGESVTATATDPSGNTSEFSACRTITQATPSWTGAVSSDWFTAANWSTNAVPTATDTVVIPSTGVTNEPSISSSNAVAATVEVQSGRTLTIANNKTLTATTLAIDAGATLHTLFNQTGFVNAAVTNNGTVDGVNANSLFDFLGTSFVNNGTVSVGFFRFGASQTLSGTGSITSGTVEIISGSTVTLASDHTLGNLSVSDGAFDQGTGFNLTVGPLSLSSLGTFKNLGTGDLTLAGDVFNGGTIQLNGGGAACGDADSILIRSSVAGTQRAWSGAGTFTLTDVDVKDQAGTATINALSSTNSGNNGANWNIVAACASTDLAITNNDSPDPVVVGNQLTYTITVKNNGPDAATGISVNDSLPAGVSFISATPSQGSCSGTGSVNCQLGSLSGGEAASVVIVVNANNVTTLNDTATVTGVQPDPDTTNNSATATTNVIPPPTFSISGHVADPANNPLVGVNIHLGGSATADVTTDTNGDYTFANLTQGGNYTLTPTEVNFRFSPASAAVNNLHDDAANVNFTGQFVNHTITGHIVDAQGNPIPGVTVTLAGSFSAVTRTDAQGNFSFPNIPESGSFVVTPEKEGFVFNPAHQSVTGVTTDTQFQSVGTAQPSPTPTPDQSDDFSGGPDPDPSKWVRGILTNPPPAFDPLVRVFLAGGLLHVQPRPDADGPHYGGLVSVRALDLNQTPITSVEVVQAATGGGAQTIFGLGRDSDNWFRFSVVDDQPSATPTPTPTSTPTPSPDPNATPSPTPNASPTPHHSSAKGGAGGDTTGQTLLFEINVGGQKFSVGIAYNPAQQRFWRFRHDAPAHQIIFETSPDAANWTERFRATLPADQAQLIAELSAGTFRPTPQPVEALFDNFLISPSPQLQFSNSDFSVLESAGTAQVQVIRTGSAESPDAVDFATSDGTARAGHDYTATSGTLVFGISERVKTISIPVINNNIADGNRTVNITLSNAVGGRLGSITRAVLTILDDERSSNPIDDTTFFVTQQYLDFLGRAPDADGLAFWVRNIDSCGSNSQCREVKRIDTSAAFFLSIEFQETGYVVDRFYVATFGRAPTFDEYLPDLATLRDGVIIGQPGAEDRLAANQQLFASQWVARPAFKQAYDKLNEAQYVDALAANAGIKLDEQTRTALVVGLLTKRETRAGVLLEIIENDAFAHNEFNPAFVRMEYFGYLRRDPDTAGFNFWLAKLNHSGGDFRAAEMVKAFLSSTEYRARFGQP